MNAVVEVRKHLWKGLPMLATAGVDVKELMMFCSEKEPFYELL
jgi:hypothetical protein